MSTFVPGTPYTIAHFEKWARKLILDTGDPWPIKPWQLEIVEDILDGVTEVWVVIPQGNAKTTLMAAVALYHADYVPSPWVPIGAAARDQAEIMFSQARGFVENTPGMAERFRVYDGYRKIVLRPTEDRPATGRGIKVYAADEKTGDGVIPSMAFLDEGHRHKDLRLYRLWRGKLRKRNIDRVWRGKLPTAEMSSTHDNVVYIAERKGTIVMTSTAGEPGADFERTRENMRTTATNRTRRGQCYLRAEGPQHVLHEYAIPSPAYARDLDIVKQANPLMTISKKDLKDALESPSLDFGEDWLRLTCNIPARSAKAAVSEIQWDNAYLESGIPEGEPVCVGADFAWVLDTTALVPFWMPSLDHRVLGEASILEPPGNNLMLDPQEVHDAFTAINERNPIKMVVMDMTKAQETAMWLQDEFPGVRVIDRPQTNVLACEDYESFTEALREGWLHHSGDQGLRTHVMNAIAAKRPNDKYRFDRPIPSRTMAYQDTRVIDALTAAAMVHLTAVAEFTFRKPEPMIAVVAR